MKRDFTITEYRFLLLTLLDQGYSFDTFVNYQKKPDEKQIILRHDVDSTPLNSLRFAQLQASLGSAEPIILGWCHKVMNPKS